MLHECIRQNAIEKILVLGRRACGIQHPKVQEILLPDFSTLATRAAALVGYDACFFCLGVSAVGMKESDYRRQTFDLTIGVAQVLCQQNPGMRFCYISGAGTDSSQHSRQMWARVKGLTENTLLEMPFKRVYCFRPGYMQPTPGLKNTLPYYKYVKWMYPLLRRIFPGFVTTLQELAQAMIQAALAEPAKQILEVPDIVALAQENRQPEIVR